MSRRIESGSETSILNDFDPERVEQAQAVAEEARSERDRELSDIRMVLGRPEGRRFLWRILGRCGLDSPSFRDDNYTEFREGQRNIGLFIKHEIVSADGKLFADVETQRGR